MALCLFDPADGYYTTREPFGAAGDFITAPEISQMFGELVGVWLTRLGQRSAAPTPVTIAEIGPGRGTLMKDMLRTLSRLDPGSGRGAAFAMIETSPTSERSPEADARRDAAAVRWHETIDNVPDEPLLIVGNELFDAVPIRQFVRAGDRLARAHGRPRRSEKLHFSSPAPARSTRRCCPPTRQAPQGAIVEVARPPAASRRAWRQRCIARDGGAGLFIDYGQLQTGVGDTLQALRRQHHEDVLANPGEADLTAHVDFERLMQDAREGGAVAFGPLEQGDFLRRLGIEHRAAKLKADAKSAVAVDIDAALARLTGSGPSQMGALFKAAAFAHTGFAVAAFDLP